MTVDELKLLITANADQMRKEIGRARADIDAIASNATKASSTVSGSFRGMGAGAVAMGGLVAAGISKAIGAITSTLGDAVSRVDTLNNFPRVMGNLGISAEDAQKSIDYMSQKLVGLPTTLDTAASAVQRLTAANGNVKASTEMFLAMNNAIIAGGAPAQVQASAIEQLSQAYAKGKPDMMEWRNMMTAMPAQLKQVAQYMGYASSNQLGEALRSGTVSMNDFMKAMIELNQNGANGIKPFSEQALGAAGGIETAITNMKTAFTRGLADIMNAIGQSNIAGFFQMITNAINAAIPYVVGFVKVMVMAVSWIGSLFGGGGKKAEGMKKAVDSVGKSVGGVGAGAAGAGKQLGGAAGQAKKLKKELAGLAAFDEMNVLKEPEDNAGGGGGGGGDAGGGGMDMSGLDFDLGDMDKGASKADEIAQKIKDSFLKAFEVIQNTKSWQAFANGVTKIFGALADNGKRIFTSISNIVVAEAGAWSTVISQRAGEIDEHFANLITSISNTTATLANVLLAPFTGFFEGLESVVVPRAEEIANNFTTAFLGAMDITAKISELANSFLEPLVEPLRQGFSDIGYLAGTIPADLLQGLADATPQIVDNLTGLMENMKSVFTQISTIVGTIWTDFTGTLKSTWDTYGKDISKGIGEFLGNITGIFKRLYSEILEPIIKPFLDEFQKVWKEQLQPAQRAIADFIGKLVVGALEIYNKFIAPISNWLITIFKPVWVAVYTTIGGLINTTLSTIGGFVRGVFTVLGGLVDFIAGVFTGNWKKAFEGLKSIVGGALGALGAIAKAPINALIDIINGFINGLNQIKIPDWVPGVGGKNMNIPKIPKLARGGVVDRATLAVVGEAGREAVVPLENNTGWLDKIASQLAEKGGAGSQAQTIIVKIGEDELVRRVIDGINDQSYLNNQGVILV
jgi:tape measure domain-containing protein